MTDVVSQSGYAKSPFDWYVEQQWVTRALIDAERAHSKKCEPYSGRSVAWGVVWDPACGSGNVLKGFLSAIQHVQLHSTDIEFRGYAAQGLFQEANFVGELEFTQSTAPKSPFSIVSNPPYSYKKGILEAFIRRALELATNKVAMLVPIARQAGENRHALFEEFPPARIYVLSERPSMPPGAQIAVLGDMAYKRGKIDFMWVVWDRRNPTPVGETKWATIAPRTKAERGVLA
jgi:hypothetical protein